MLERPIRGGAMNLNFRGNFTLRMIMLKSYNKNLSFGSSYLRWAHTIKKIPLKT